MRTLYASKSDLWVDISKKHVYYVLRKLERDGLLAVDEAREGNLPTRKIYSITSAGRAALAHMLTSQVLGRALPHSDFDAVFGILGYTDAISDAEKDAVLERRDRFLADTAAETRRLAAELPDTPGFAPVQVMVLQKVARMAEAERAWLADTREEIARAGWTAVKTASPTQEVSE